MSSSNESYDQYLNRRIAAGWTPLILDGNNSEEINEWLLIHVGKEHPGDNWGDPLPDAEWEQMGHSEYIIRQPDKAMLTKLTWA